MREHHRQSGPKRRAPRAGHGLAPSISITLIGGTAIGIPVFGLAAAIAARPHLYSDPLLADVGDAAGWLPLSAARTSLARTQDDALGSLQAVLAALAALLLAIAIINLLTLVLMRVSSRRRDIALRAALGAGRRVLAGQLLREALLPVVVVPCIGLLAGFGAHHLLVRAWPGDAPPWSAGGIGAGTLLLALGLFIVLPAAAWMAPVSMAWRQDLHRFLAGGTRSTAGPGETLGRTGLAALQVAGSVVLLVSGGLLLRALAPPSGDAALDPPFDPRDSVVVQIRAADPSAALLERTRRRIAAIPGVVDTSISTPGAWLGVGTVDRVTAICPECVVGTMIKPVSEGPAMIHAVSPGFFESLGVPILAGRELAPEDGSRTDGVVVISDTFAHRLLPNGEPLGKRVQLGGPDGEMFTVVGVVEDVGAAGVGVRAEPVSTLYLPIDRHPPAVAGLAVRVAGAPGAFVPDIERAVQALGPSVRAGEAMSMDEYLARFRAPLGWFAKVFALLAIASLVLAGCGVHALMSFNAARRSREIGVRMAVGARPRDVVRLIVGQSLRITTFGVVVGLIATSGVARLLQLLVGAVHPLDPMTFGIVLVLLGSVAVVASYRPARRAAAADPQISLRLE